MRKKNRAIMRAALTPEQLERSKEWEKKWEKEESKREKRATITKMVVGILVLACLFALEGCTTLSSPKQETKTTLPSLTDALRDASTCWEKALLAYDRKALITHDSPISKRIYRCLVNKGYIQTTTKPGTVAISKAEILEACMYCRPAGYVCPQNTFRIFDCLEMYRKQGMPKDQ